MSAKKRPVRTRPSLRPPPLRDTDASSFSEILSDLVARIPGALAAVLVDGDGEAVDYTGRLSPFDLKLAGAHWQIVVRQFAEAKSLGVARSLLVRGASRSFVAHVLPDHYVLIVVLSRRAGFTAGASRAFPACERALCQEAAWRLRPQLPLWVPFKVTVGRQGRPQRLRPASPRDARDHPLEVLGRLTGLAPREQGWRVRLEGGAELMLVREPGGHWYGDLLLDSLVPPAAPPPASPRSR
ncbi:MAG TPA: roadblock/LC7 domain-containing protein [Polyangiaceae bacterium]